MSYIEKVTVKGQTYLREMESYRAEGKMKHRVIKNLGAELPPSSVKAALWCRAHTLGHIAVKADDPIYRFVAEAVAEGSLTSSPLPCHLVPAGKARNGAEQKWCRTHQQYFGRKKDTHNCSHADITMDYHLAPVVIDPRLFPGQLAMWAALAPAICTRPSFSASEPTGIHVHGRSSSKGKKAIDATYPCLILSVPSEAGFDELVITPPAAEGWLYAYEHKLDMGAQRCNHCSSPHLDLGHFAQAPHKRHLCGNCGRMFGAKGMNVSNPLCEVNELLGAEDHGIQLAKGTLDISSAHFAGGVEVWASTPAFLWKADRPQVVGIHVHAYDAKGARQIDETYGAVTLDGRHLDRAELLKAMMHEYKRPSGGDMFTAHKQDLK